MTTISIYLLTWTNKKDNKSRFYLDLGLILILASTILGAFANLTLDFASNKVGTYAFTFVAYALGFIFSYFISKLGLEKNDSNSSGKNWNSQVILMGVAIGFFNLFGLVFFIEALKSGAFSIVGAINNFSLLLTIGLSVLIYKERPTTKQILGIVLAFISLFLFRA